MISGSRISYNTCNIKWDKSKALIMTLTSTEIVLLTTWHKSFHFQAIIWHTVLFFPARKITCPPMLLPDGKLARDVLF